MPQQPASSPWAEGIDQASGVEPPLGFSINDQEAVGTPVEIEQSIRALKDDVVVGANALPSTDNGSMAPNDATALSSSVEPGPNSPSSSSASSAAKEQEGEGIFIR